MLKTRVLCEVLCCKKNQNSHDETTVAGENQKRTTAKDADIDYWEEPIYADIAKIKERKMLETMPNNGSRDSQLANFGDATCHTESDDAANGNMVCSLRQIFAKGQAPKQVKGPSKLGEKGAHSNNNMSDVSPPIPPKTFDDTHSSNGVKQGEQFNTGAATFLENSDKQKKSDVETTNNKQTVNQSTEEQPKSNSGSHPVPVDKKNNQFSKSDRDKVLGQFVTENKNIPQINKSVSTNLILSNSATSMEPKKGDSTQQNQTRSGANSVRMSPGEVFKNNTENEVVVKTANLSEPKPEQLTSSSVRRPKEVKPSGVIEPTRLKNNKNGNETSSTDADSTPPAFAKIFASKQDNRKSAPHVMLAKSNKTTETSSTSTSQFKNPDITDSAGVLKLTPAVVPRESKAPTQPASRPVSLKPLSHDPTMKEVSNNLNVVNAKTPEQEKPKSSFVKQSAAKQPVPVARQKNASGHQQIPGNAQNTQLVQTNKQQHIAQELPQVKLNQASELENQPSVEQLSKRSLASHENQNQSQAPTPVLRGGNVTNLHSLLEEQSVVLSQSPERELIPVHPSTTENHQHTDVHITSPDVSTSPRIHFLNPISTLQRQSNMKNPDPYHSVHIRGDQLQTMTINNGDASLHKPSQTSQRLPNHISNDFSIPIQMTHDSNHILNNDRHSTMDPPPYTEYPTNTSEQFGGSKVAAQLIDRSFFADDASSIMSSSFDDSSKIQPTRYVYTNPSRVEVRDPVPNTTETSASSNEVQPKQTQSTRFASNTVQDNTSESNIVSQFGTCSVPDDTANPQTNPRWEQQTKQQEYQQMMQQQRMQLLQEQKQEQQRQEQQRQEQQLTRAATTRTATTRTATTRTATTRPTTTRATTTRATTTRATTTRATTTRATTTRATTTRATTTRATTTRATTTRATTTRAATTRATTTRTATTRTTTTRATTRAATTRTPATRTATTRAATTRAATTRTATTRTRIADSTTTTTTI